MFIAMERCPAIGYPTHRSGGSVVQSLVGIDMTEGVIDLAGGSIHG